MLTSSANRVAWPSTHKGIRLSSYRSPPATPSVRCFALVGSAPYRVFGSAEALRTSRGQKLPNKQKIMDDDVPMVEEDEVQEEAVQAGEIIGGDSSQFIKVSAKGNVKAVAGKIAHSCREGDPPAALCIGAECINHAVKAIAIARNYLTNDSIDVSFQPAFRDTDRSKKSLALYLSKLPTRAPISTVDDVEMHVGSQSKPQIVAGALAARIREEKTVCIKAIGIDAVANAVLAIGNARLYLEQDHKDIRAQPEIVTVQKDDRELHAIKFSLMVENI